ncbi:phage portal protein [Ensifer sp. LC163]|uniref:portal protein n=1 Tax=Ensifer sp. LC163 TaxID=1120652 RepID=UPI000812D4A2|nr:phage portal protein [Ensifer sp. LC163]OCP38640.1 phage portal protein [Ensifer sp. LC163]
MAAMTKPELTSLVSQLVRDCETYRDALSVDRIRAMEYYDGVMKDVPSDSNRSKVVSRDVRAAVKKVLPSLIRTVLGNDKVVEYEPVNQGDEAGAEQATDYINYIVFPESDGYDAVQDAAHDALKLRNGVIRWWYEKKQTVEVSSHTGLDEAALVQLIADDAVEVLEQSQSIETIELPTGRVEQPVFNVKIRRTGERGTTRLAAVPLEEFLIHPDAISIDDSPITGINLRMRRSDLIAMGYDRAKVEGFAVAGDHDGDDEAFARRRDVFGDGEATATALQEVEYYELYVKVDADDDGIAELRRLVFAGGTGPDNLLEDEEWDEVPFADLITERRPHQREGNSVTDDMAEIQRVKTVLLRQTLDNLYWQNNQQPIVQEGVIQNPESVLNPKFGQPIRVGQGVDVRGAVGYTAVPFVARESFSMLGYLDQEATDRTGISDASSGMAPDALQNMTAKATALVEQAGIGQTELMVRTFAQGLKRVFKGLLGLVIKHQDRPRAVRLRGQWVTFDPRHWNAGMDATVNTGLGAGTRERDMLMIQMIQQLQEKLLMTLGPDNPYVSPDNLYNGIAKTVEAAGLKSPDLYFTKPTPEDIQKRMQAAKPQQQPDVGMQRLQMEAQLAAEKTRMESEAARRKLEMERELKLEEIQQDGALKRYQIDAELNLKREQNLAEMAGGTALTTAHIGGTPG